MPTLSYQAHFDGQHIQLDEPALLETGAKLMVTVVASTEKPAQVFDQDPDDEERRDWLAISQAGLARAYGDDEPEYTLADCRGFSGSGHQFPTASSQPRIG